MVGILSDKITSMAKQSESLEECALPPPLEESAEECALPPIQCVSTDDSWDKASLPLRKKAKKEEKTVYKEEDAPPVLEVDDELPWTGWGSISKKDKKGKKGKRIADEEEEAAVVSQADNELHRLEESQPAFPKQFRSDNTVVAPLEPAIEQSSLCPL